MRFRTTLRPFSGLLSGTSSVGSGVLAAGLFTYLFLSLSGRVLGASGFAPVSTLWAMVFIVGPGLFMPVQQELGRVIAGQRGERGGSNAVGKIALITSGFAVFIIAFTLAAAPWITEQLLGGSWALLWCFEGAVVAYALMFVVRGIFSGLGDYRNFGRLVAIESFARLVIGAVVTLLGARSAIAFGLAIALAPIISAAAVTRLGSKVRLRSGPHVSWRQVTKAMGWLVLGSVMAQFLANAGPLAVQLLTPSTQENRTGVFLSALVVARLSLYLFQAVQATLLPNLAELLATGRIAELRQALRRLMVVGAVLVAVTALGGLFLGPFAVRLLFGSAFSVSGATMAALAGASGIYVLASTMSAVAIASSGYRLNALSWFVGCLAFTAGILFSDDLFVRVELGYLCGSCATAAVFLIGLPVQLRHYRAITRAVSNTSTDDRSMPTS
ncbi:MAG: hypothetical protein ABIR57_01970 [Aeromicrobium sp.]